MKKISVIIVFCFILLSQTVFADLSNTREFKDGCYSVRENRAWALFDKNGKQILPYNYRYISEGNEGLRYIEPVRKKVVYDIHGKKLYDFDKYSVEKVYKNTLALRYNNKYALATKKGKLITDFIYDLINIQWSDGLISANKGEKAWTFIDEKGKQILPGYFDSVDSYDKGRITAFKNGTFYNYDINGKLIRSCKKGTPEEEKCFPGGTSLGAYFTDNGAYKYCQVYYDNEKGKAGAYCVDENTEKVTIRTPAIYPQINTRVFDKYIYAEEFDGIKYIDEKGNVIIDIKDESIITVRDFSEGLAAVRRSYPEKRGKTPGVIDDGTRWGFMDKTGKIVIPTIYKNASNFKDGVAKVWLPGEKEPRHIDKKGKYVNL